MVCCFFLAGEGVVCCFFLAGPEVLCCSFFAAAEVPSELIVTPRMTENPREFF